MIDKTMTRARFVAAMLVIICSHSLVAQSDPLAFVQAKLAAIKTDAQSAIDRNKKLKPNSRLPVWVTDTFTRIVDASNLALAESQFIVRPAAQAPGCTITATGGTITEVQNAVNNAVDGNTVCIPAGSFTWATPLTITNKRINLTGPACTMSDVTPPITVPACSLVITGNVGAQPIITITTCLAADFVSLGNFTLRVTSVGDGEGMIIVNCSNANGYPEQAFRVHHVQFDGDATDGTTDNSSGKRWFTAYGAYGLLDHNQFLAQTVRGMGNVSAAQDNAPTTPNSYHQPFSFGDNLAVYMEDNLFYSAVANQGNGASDNYTGARYVFRMNTVYNNNWGHHGLDSQPRGVPSFESYGNTFIAEAGIGSITLFTPRSGTGILWGNSIQNSTTASNGYIAFLSPIYYGAMHGGNLLDRGLWDAGRSSNGIYYPTTPWGGTYQGTSSITNSGAGFYVGYGNVWNFDGNQFAADSMDADYTRTITDLTTTSASDTVTSATASFTGTSPITGDTSKYIVSTLFKRGFASSTDFTSGSKNITCTGCSFTSGDIGRHVSNDQRTSFVSGASDTFSTTCAATCYVARIKTVTDATHAIIDRNANSTMTSYALYGEPVIVSVTNATTAVMSVQANATGSTGTMSIGYSNQGYPLLDQPGRGYFATANAGNWPNTSSYSDANYEQLMPIYNIGNKWLAKTGVWSNPPATDVYFPSTISYIKPNREWYDPVGGIQTNATTPFNGTVGSGIGTAANKPTTCTAGVGYWTTDEGSWNGGSFSYTYPDGGSTYTQGRLYKCTSTNTWTLYYTPYTYPHPLVTP